jgi:hypothetical protein
MLAVPFASHRESYSWMGMVHDYPFSKAFSLIASTYRPLAQATSWTGFLLLDPSIFPTSFVRQLFLQCLVYFLFLGAWWIVYSATSQRRVLGLTSLVAGGVFFSGYVHLFHIYGLSYVPVILMLGCLLRSHNKGNFERLEIRFASAAGLLALWHPFATGLFAGYYFGHYLRRAPACNRQEHVRSIVILAICVCTIASLVLFFAPGFTKSMDNSGRWAGFIASYQTNEINFIASVVALIFAQVCVLSLPVGNGFKLALGLAAIGLAWICLGNGVPVLFLWLGLVLFKLILRADWPQFFLALSATMLPFGGGIGTPMHSLFAIVVAVYVTAQHWRTAEQRLGFLKPWHVGVFVVALVFLIAAVRSGSQVKLLSNVAKPLLAERERTYQLESALAWLHKSEYCDSEIDFVTESGNPADSVEKALSRQHRPPAWIGDVRLFWNNRLRCIDGEGPRIALMTFGDQELQGSKQVLAIEGSYAGKMGIWIKAAAD